MTPRYIDANQIQWHSNWLISDDARVFAYQDEVDNIPAADVEEVRHATWECTDESDNVWECSGKDGCGEQYTFIEGTPEDNNYKRCPSCGAKMDGKLERRETWRESDVR